MKQQKTISVFTYDLNKDNKYNKIYEYALLVRETKNIVSKYVFDNLLYEVLTNTIKQKYLYKEVKHLKPTEILGSTFQLFCEEIYISYMNNKDLYYKFDDNINNIERYIIKTIYPTMSFEELKNKINKSKNKFVKEEALPNLTKALYDKCLKLQQKVKLKSKPIEFNSLGFRFKNVLKYEPDNLMFQKSNNKHTNGIVLLKTKGDLLNLPFRYSKKYHKDLFNKQGGVTTKTLKDGSKKFHQRQYLINIFPIENKKEVKISICVEEDIIQPVFENITVENTIGIDINLKHSLMNFSNGDSIEKDNNQIKKSIRLQNKLAKIQQTKSKQNKTEEKYGKKITKRITKNSRRNKYYNDFYAFKLKQYCIKNNIKNVVIEDLHLQGKLRSINKELNIRYSNLIKILHINDLKNSIQRILNKANINVHFVNAEYTSQPCPICGHISKNNRKTQETFCCVECGYTNNADINSAINIKNRVVNRYLCNELELLEDNHYVGKFKKHSNKNKSVYINVYKDLYINNYGCFI